MIFDFEIEKKIHKSRYDVVIVGSGVAGIILATQIDPKASVLLIEGGGIEFSEPSQEVYRGTILGQGTKYRPLDEGRWRAFGGTSNIWGGYCVDLDDFDFDFRPHIPESGWPIDKSTLAPYRQAAARILGVDIPDNPRPFINDNTGLDRFSFGRSTRSNLAETYEDTIRESGNIDLYLNCNYVDLGFAESGNSVRSIAVSSYRDPEARTNIPASYFVLAMGGIENIRSLLCSARKPGSPLNEISPTLGRYYMDHPTASVGWYLPDKNKKAFFEEEFFVKPSVDLTRKLSIGNFFLSVRPPVSTSEDDDVSRKIKKFLCSPRLSRTLLQKLGHGEMCQEKFDPRFGRVFVFSEQTPNSSSRIFLGEERDKFGNERVILDWNLDSIDVRTVQVAIQTLGASVALADLARVRVEDFLLDEVDDASKVLGGGHHHIGGARMGISARDGVVDADCKVFGQKNLFVAGSSVFRTSGAANPTFTIAQLAVRMAERISKLI